VKHCYYPVFNDDENAILVAKAAQAGLEVASYLRQIAGYPPQRPGSDTPTRPRGRPRLSTEDLAFNAARRRLVNQMQAHKYASKPAYSLVREVFNRLVDERKVPPTIEAFRDALAFVSTNGGKFGSVLPADALRRYEASLKKPK